jgi:hypothetical protein
MIFEGLNIKRVEFLMRPSGVYKLLIDFFKTNDKKLRLNDASFRNIPKASDQAIEIFINLPPKCRPVAKAYFDNHKLDESKLELDEIIAELKEVESSNRKLEKSQIEQYMAKFFIELLKEDPDKSLLKFMASPMKGDKENKISEIKNEELIVKPKEKKQQNLQYIQPDYFLEKVEDFLPEDHKIIAQLSRQISNASYFKPIGILNREKMLLFYEADIPDLFPSNGEIVGFGNTLGILKEGHYGIFTVDKVDNNKGCHYKVKSFIDELYFVLDSKVNDKTEHLRAWLIQNEKNIINENAYIVYSDYIVRVPQNNGKVNFNEAFEKFSNVMIYMYKGNFLIHNPGSSNQSIDLSPNDYLLRKILKETKLNKFTQSDIDSICTALMEYQKSSKDRLEELRENLSDLIGIENLKKDIVKDYLESPEIKSEIQNEILQIISKENDRANEIKKLIESYDNQISDKKKKLEKLDDTEKEIRKKEQKEFRNNIRAIFTKAQSEGKETLSQVALYNAILNGDETGSRNTFGNKYFTYELFSNNRVEYDTPDLPSTKTQLKFYKEVIENLLKIGFIPCLVGKYSKLYASFIANTGYEKIHHFNIQPGITFCEELNNLDLDDPKSIILINDYDISFLNIYAPSLSEKFALRLFNSEVSDYAGIILTPTEENLRIGKPQALSDSIVEIDLYAGQIAEDKLKDFDETEFDVLLDAKSEMGESRYADRIRKKIDDNYSPSSESKVAPDLRKALKKVFFDSNT